MLSDLSATDTNQLGNKDLTLSISCTAPTKVAWTIIDDRADSAQTDIQIKNAGWNNSTAWGSTSLFGVGKTAGGVNLGAYAIAMHTTSFEADGNNATALLQGIGQDWWAYTITEIVQSSEYNYTVGPAGSGSLYPEAFTTATFPLRVSLAIQGTDTLAITDDTPIDGQATISLVYL